MTADEFIKKHGLGSMHQNMLHTKPSKLVGKHNACLVFLCDPQETGLTEPVTRRPSSLSRIPGLKATDRVFFCSMPEDWTFVSGLSAPAISAPAAPKAMTSSSKRVIVEFPDTCRCGRKAYIGLNAVAHSDGFIGSCSGVYRKEMSR